MTCVSFIHPWIVCHSFIHDVCHSSIHYLCVIHPAMTCLSLIRPRLVSLIHPRLVCHWSVQDLCVIDPSKTCVIDPAMTCVSLIQPWRLCHWSIHDLCLSWISSNHLMIVISVPECAPKTFFCKHKITLKYDMTNTDRHAIVSLSCLTTHTYVILSGQGIYLWKKWALRLVPLIHNISNLKVVIIYTWTFQMPLDCSLIQYTIVVIYYSTALGTNVIYNNILLSDGYIWCIWLINNFNIIGYFIYRLKSLALYYNMYTRLCLMNNLYLAIFNFL